MIEFINDNGVLTMAVYYIFISAVAAMPKAEKVAGQGMKFLIRFLNILAGNLDKLRKEKA